MSIQSVVPTFTATIYCGLRVNYGERNPTHEIQEARVIASEYCDRVGLGVSVTPTSFIYTNGSEPGVIVGLINYPRFPSTPAVIRDHALTLAELLRGGLDQMRVSVVFPDETVMIGEEGKP